MNLIPSFIRFRIAHRPNLVKIVDNIGWLLLDKTLRMGVGLFVAVWMARYLGPEEFGQLSFATAFVSLFGAVAGLGLQGIVVRDIVCDPTRSEETLGAAAVLQLFSGLLAYGLILAVIFWMRPEDTVAVTLAAILGSVMMFKVGDVALFWFESQVQSKYTVWVQNSVLLLFAGVKVALIQKQASLIAFAWAIMAEALLVALLMLVLLKLRGPKLRLLHGTIERAKTLLRDSWPQLLAGISWVFYMRIDQIMLGEMAGDEALGIYSVAARISEVWYFIPVMFSASLFPAILDAKKRSDAEYDQRMQRLYDLMAWLSVGVALPMTFLSTPLVTLLFGGAYAESGVVLTIHIWSAVFVFLGVASGRWFLAENRQILNFQRTLFGAITNIVLNLALIPRFGPVGAAVATVISHAVAFFFSDILQKETRKMLIMKASALTIVLSIGRKM